MKDPRSCAWRKCSDTYVNGKVIQVPPVDKCLDHMIVSDVVHEISY